MTALVAWWVLRLGIALRQRRFPQWHHRTKGAASFQVEASLVRVGMRELPLPALVVLMLVAVLILRENIAAGWSVNLLGVFALFHLPAGACTTTGRRTCCRTRCSD
jgi:hypothetical protein